MNSSAVTALLFGVADQRYGLDVSQIVEVVPAVRLRTIPGTPDYVAGVFRYKGSIVPVIDLNQMLSGRPAEKRYSTRVILVRFPGTSGVEHVLGLMVERADQGLTEPVGDLQSSGISTPDAPYLGKLATLGKETIQFVKIEHLIPDKLRNQLFTED
jgi:chemotaxis-related protein WspB